MPINRATEGVLGVAGLAVEGGTVTGAAGAATLNTLAGVITTESLTTAAGAQFTETLTDNRIEATDIVLASVSTTGTGTPVLAEITPAAGSCVFVIQNIHATVAFNAALKIYFFVVKQS